ncbi:MAG TPA: hypothetical protein G4O08_13090 [Anaerolineae bacterium]|nr:hypothetical protein [Anaerolineae bacterium]
MSAHTVPPMARDPILNVRRALKRLFNRASLDRGLFYGIMILLALIAFEIFNYGTTQYAFKDLLGDLSFAHIPWATILALAFCGIDFAGIARLFSPDRGRGELVEAWYLLAAWFLAATMNALLTWWAVTLALLEHSALGNEILARQDLMNVVPVFVAILVWLMRVLMIGTFTLAGGRWFKQDATRTPRMEARRRVQRPARMAQPSSRTWSPPSFEPESMVASSQTRH